MILLDLTEELKWEKEPLGTGSSSKVHRAHRKSDPSKVFALKSIQKSFITKSASYINSCLLEIELMREMDHPHVIKLYEVYESKKYIHLLLPLLKDDLFTRIK